MHISSSYAKILGETNFRTQEIPQSGSKAKDGEKNNKAMIKIYILAQAASSSAFDPLRGISHVRNNFSPNILA